MRAGGEVDVFQVFIMDLVPPMWSLGPNYAVILDLERSFAALDNIVSC